ncbi:transcriptional activator leucine zipper [Scheffersomyces amazonensis]|uniref:transcriptional activator leucine zipper n=1 Tax=Scheffersomyces amazonensis TaxID=1078765 RepID=UPI00315DDD19
MSQIISNNDHTEPSPQLPPPDSSSTNSQKLMLSNGEEFSSLRRGLATESKTPAEYTLHIVFTQFVRHAERKLNSCLEYPLDIEPPIIELLSEGVDPHFDKIVASLGYIARKKPKPVIDSVMFWRKSKSEVATMAANEVERTLETAKSSLLQVSRDSSDSTIVNPSNPGIIKGGNVASRSKRSLSLMRSKSFSKVAHRRNQSTSSALPSNSNSNSTSSSSITNTKTPGWYEDEFIKQKYYYDARISEAKKTAIQAERKSLASIYILCRVLIEVVKQTSYEIMGEDLEDKLEEIVYTQLKTTDPISTSQSLVRAANWNLFAELLGFMSEKRFLSVSDRFIADLERIPSNIKQEDEPKLHLLISGMRYLILTNYPLEVFEESADFINSLAKFFSSSQNETIIFAYCEVLSHLVLPLANILTAETNHPTWVEGIEKIYYKAQQIWNHYLRLGASTTTSTTTNTGSSSAISFANSGWAYSLHLMTSTLSVSKRDLFSEKWMKVIEDNSFKLKPKVEVDEKTTYIVCIGRLIWVYIYRLPDTLNNTVKKLDQLFQLLFFNNNSTSKKQQWITFDNLLIGSLVELIRIIGFNHLNYVLDDVFIKLLKLSFTGISLENMYTEKIILVVKSYLSILQDYEYGNKPNFPTDEIFNMRFLNDIDGHSKSQSTSRDKKKHKYKSSEFSFIARNSTNAQSHDEICRTFGTLLKLLDTQYGSEILQSDNSNSNPPTPISSTKSASPFSAFHFGIDLSYQITKNVHTELFATLIEVIPWTMVSHTSEMASAAGIPFKQIIEILTRNSIHENYRVANAAIGSLKRLASRKNSSNLITTFAKLAFHLNDKPNPHFDINYMNSSEFSSLLRIYVELLNCWLKQFQEIAELRNGPEEYFNPLAQDDELMNKDVLNDLYQINHKNEDLSNSSANAPIDSSLSDTNKLKPGDELEWKTIITVIEEVEGNGLFFLCSQDCKIRHYGITILKLVEQFDQAIYNITDESSKSLNSTSNSSRKHSRSSSKFAADVGTRLIHTLEDVDFLELIKPFRKELSLPERTRLSKLKNRKNILIRLAESDYGIDSTIWFRVYPKLLDIFFERCPIAVALCRSIICVTVLQMHEFVLEYSENNRSYTPSIFTRSTITVPSEVLINQWKLYLIFACSSLTSTNDQKISFPNHPTHGRKRSMQIFIQHQKITSAKSIFRMVIPLLRSQQQMVREAVISGLSSVNINIFKSLLESMPTTVTEWDINNKRDTKEDSLRIEMIRVILNNTTRFKNAELIYNDEGLIANLVAIIKNLKTFLSLPSTQISIEFQRLRRYFCGFLENIFVGLESKSDLNKWLPFEARIGCFNYLKEWCGYGESSSLADDRYNSMVKRVNQQKEVASVVAILEVEKKALQNSALSCMAVLCSGHIKHNLNLEIPGQQAVMSFDIPALMDWIHALFTSDNDKAHEIGRIALRNILSLNLSTPEIYQEVIKQCYTSQKFLKTTDSYFTIFVEVFLKSTPPDDIPYDLMCLAGFLVGHDSYEVRFGAIKLLKYLENQYYHTCTTSDKFTESVTCKTKVVYKRALFDISNHIATLQPEGAFIRISYMTKYFNLVDNSSRRDILSCLLPWVQTVVLNYTTTNEDNSNDNDNDNEIDNDTKKSTLTTKKLDNSSLMVLCNLFEITVKFSSKISNEVEALWVALGGKPNNFDKIIEFIMNNCLERKNPTFVEYSRQIIDYLAFSQSDPNIMIDKLLDNLQPKLMVPPLSKISAITINNDNNNNDNSNNNNNNNNNNNEIQFPYIANLWKIIAYNEKDAAFSIGQLSMVFLVDLLTLRNDKMLEKLPLLLHVAFSLLDHYLFIVQEQAGTLLIHLIHALAPNAPNALETIQTLRQRDHYKYLWVYDDLNNDKKGARTPKNMDLLARNILKIFSTVHTNIQDDWSRVSLNWATTCAVRHIACRSFQVFRSLLSFLDQGMLKDMLHRLSNTISDETLDIQGFAMQILMTLNAITAELDSGQLIDFPQLFWSSVACLSTIHEQEFIEVLSTLNKFVSKIDLDAADTVSCLISTFPPKWEGKFEGLQHIVLIGLRSSTSWESSMKFLDKLNTLKDSEIIGMGNVRVLMAVLANMPRFLHALDQKTLTPEIEQVALSISKLATNADKPALARILVSLSKNRFRSKKDFLVQTISTIKSLFFPEYEAQSLVLLLGFLSNKIPWIKLETLSILKHVFPLVNLERDEFVGVGADLISPLLRLLLTDYAEAALEVLDEAVVISGSQLDRDVLRMSLGNTSIKKEYEKTATLFGIPDESGWAIPMPAVTAASTRNNVHAVFSTCVITTLVDENEEPTKDEEFQFHLEDYYAPVNDYGDTVSVSVDEPEASLSNVWAALDDFDSFFTKDTENNGTVPVSIVKPKERRDLNHIHSASVDTKYSNSSDNSAPMDSAPNIYDKKVSVILNRSLARTQSTNSFKTNLADSIGPTNYNHQGGTANAKRSYIPFRSSRSSLRSKTDAFTTPVMQLSPTFDPQDSTSPFKSQNLNSPSYTSTPKTVTSLETNQGYSSNDNSTRFETLLGGGKKRSKKVGKNSPNSYNSSTSAETTLWANAPNKSSLSLTGINNSPSSVPVEPGNKLRDKKSQKFR